MDGQAERSVGLAGRDVGAGQGGHDGSVRDWTLMVFVAATGYCVGLSGLLGQDERLLLLEHLHRCLIRLDYGGLASNAC